MVEYSLSIKVDKYWVKYYNEHGWKLCFARKAQSVGSKSTFNVVAYADEVAENVNISWEDVYGMAAAKTGFSAGAKITISTNITNIDFGQSFTLADWADYTVQDDKEAPKDGFLFQTTPRSAAVLYQTVNGKQVPVYITPEDLLPPDTSEILIPKVEVAVWFQREIEAGDMYDFAAQKAFVIPMTTTDMKAEYTLKGTWKLETGKIKYPGLVDEAKAFVETPAITAH